MRENYAKIANNNPLFPLRVLLFLCVLCEKSFGINLSKEK